MQSAVTHDLRRSALRTAAALATTALLIPIALSGTASAAPASDVGLFGAADPTYDGAYRQSIAIIGLKAAKAPVPASAITWLTSQQCASGAFMAYRADTAAPCTAPDPAAFSGPDSNSTALAAMALTSTGTSVAARRAVAALLVAQNTDGGLGYTLGSPSDVNSTGLTLAALKGVPVTTANRKAVNRAIGRATSYLEKVQIPCTAKADSRFGLPYQAGQPVNALASGQALIGIAGTVPYTHIAATSVAGTGCDDTLVEQVSAYLDRLIRTTKGRIPSAMDAKQVDWNATASALVGLGAAGAAPKALATGIAALGANTAAYAGTGAAASPAAVGGTIQAAVGAGVSPRNFGTTHVNLVTVLLGTLRK